MLMWICKLKSTETVGMMHLPEQNLKTKIPKYHLHKNNQFITTRWQSWKEYPTSGKRSRRINRRTTKLSLLWNKGKQTFYLEKNWKHWKPKIFLCFEYILLQKIKKSRRKEGFDLDKDCPFKEKRSWTQKNALVSTYKSDGLCLFLHHLFV